MGVVVSAWDGRAGTRVAIKFLHVKGEPEVAARFMDEARTAHRLQHENVCRCHDFGYLPDGTPYMVLDLLDGEDLEQLLRRERRLPVPVAVDYILSALEAVAAAHALGIVHRDLKPENLFLCRRADGSWQVKVVDFGVAKSEGGLAQTTAQALLGSPFYMAPEQIRSARTVDRRADLWSMGVILYELVAGAGPFEAKSLAELFIAITSATPAPLTQVCRDCPPGLAAVVQRCLSTDREARYDSAADFAEALAPFAGPRGLASLARLRGTRTSDRPAAATPSLSPVAMPEPAPRGPVTVRPPPPPSRGLGTVAAVVASAIVAGAALGAGIYFVKAPRVTTAPAAAPYPVAAPAPAPTLAPAGSASASAPHLLKPE
jgi:serine/threonine-protein kinase